MANENEENKSNEEFASGMDNLTVAKMMDFSNSDDMEDDYGILESDYENEKDSLPKRELANDGFEIEEIRTEDPKPGKLIQQTPRVIVPCRFALQHAKSQRVLTRHFKRLNKVLCSFDIVLPYLMQKSYLKEIATDIENFTQNGLDTIFNFVKSRLEEIKKKYTEKGWDLNSYKIHSASSITRVYKVNVNSKSMMRFLTIVRMFDDYANRLDYYWFMCPQMSNKKHMELLSQIYGMLNRFCSFASQKENMAYKLIYSAQDKEERIEVAKEVINLTNNYAKSKNNPALKNTSIEEKTESEKENKPLEEIL